MATVNNYKYFFAIIFSGIIFFVFITLVTSINLGNPDNVSILSILLSGLFSFVYSTVVNRSAWYLGVFTSFVFWAYLILVAISLYYNQRLEWEWWPMGEALVIIMVSCLGVLLGKFVKILLVRVIS